MIPLPFFIFLSLAAEEGDLIVRLRNQDPQALADLYTLYSHPVYCVIERIVNNPAQAEDLLQEAFMRVWNRASRLSETQTSVGPWLFVVARNCALDALRSAEQQISANSIPLNPEVSTSMMTDSDVNHHERAAVLREAFAGLSASQKEVIQLAYYEGLSQTEIAARIQRPLGTVKSLIRTALERMRLDLSEFGRPRIATGQST